MTRTTPRLCGILCAAALVVALAGESAAVECRLAPNGSITTWLVTPPFRFDHRAGFEKDLLPANMGERTGLRRSEGPGKVAWRGMSAGRSFVELSERCRDRGESVFYAACELRATAPGTYILEAAFWARLAIWLDGRPLVSDEAGKEDAVFARCQAKVKLPDRRPRHLLVKLGSRSQQAFFRVALWKDAEAPGTEREPAPVRCLLRVPEGRIGGLVAGSLKISSSTGGVVYAGKPLRITAKIQAGRPLVDGPVRLHAKMLDGAGRTVKAFEPVAVGLDAPGGAAARYAWTVPDSVKERSYTFEATVRFRGQAAGTLRQTVHVAEALGDWMKQLGRRSDKLGDELGPRIYTEPDFALARLRHEKAVQYARAGEFGGSRPDKVAEELAGWERALGRLDRHKSRPIEPGLSEHAYLSMIDDSPQPYYVYVPKGHDGQTRLPLIVYLHGYSPDLNKLNWGMIPRDLLHYCDDRGYYLVAPFGRSNTDFQGIGEADVLHVLMLANKRLPVRADRVFLFGYSMGGMGVFTIGAHYPDLWAGIVSVSGRADYYLWREYERDRVEPYKRHLIDREFGAEMLGNFKNIPILICHGGDDSLVKVEQPRRLKRR
ncbi:MAG: alpha/beta hydrolase-fold protein, partial [Planctomycetota bacterium]